MKKIATSIVLIGLPLLTLAAPKSNPGDVTQFINTGKCAGCDLSGAVNLDPNTTTHMVLTNANLSRTTFATVLDDGLQKSDFSNVIGVEFECVSTDLSGSNFTNANLSNAIMQSDILKGADFTGANVKGLDFTGANLYQAKISQAQLNSTESLCGAILPDGTTKSCS